MKFSSKEQKILLVIFVTIDLYDFFTIHYNSFLIATVFAIVLYGLTESLFLVSLVYIVPQFIKLFNSLLANKDAMTDTPNTISNRIAKMSEKFTDLKEISDRVEVLQKNKPAKVHNVSGVVEEVPSGIYPIEGEPSYPKFMETVGTGLNSNTHIYTTAESTIPAIGIIDRFPKQNPYVENFDDVSINTALARTTNGNSANAANIKGM